MFNQRDFEMIYKLNNSIAVAELKLCLTNYTKYACHRAKHICALTHVIVVTIPGYMVNMLLLWIIVYY